MATVREIVSDPEFSKVSPESQVRILRQLKGDEIANEYQKSLGASATSSIGPSSTPLAPEPSTPAEAFERLVYGGGTRGGTGASTTAETPLNETDVAAMLRGGAMAAMPAMAPLLPVAPAAAAVADVGAGLSVPALLSLLGIGTVGGIGGEKLGRAVGTELGYPEMGSVAGEFGGATAGGAIGAGHSNIPVEGLQGGIGKMLEAVMPAAPKPNYGDLDLGGLIGARPDVMRPGGRQVDARPMGPAPPTPEQPITVPQLRLDAGPPAAGAAGAQQQTNVPPELANALKSMGIDLAEWMAGRGIGGLVGGAVGHPVVGRIAGGRLGSMLGRFFGRGGTAASAGAAEGAPAATGLSAADEATVQALMKQLGFSRDAALNALIREKGGPTSRRAPVQTQPAAEASQATGTTVTPTDTSTPPPVTFSPTDTFVETTTGETFKITKGGLLVGDRGTTEVYGPREFAQDVAKGRFKKAEDPGLTAEPLPEEDAGLPAEPIPETDIPLPAEPLPPELTPYERMRQWQSKESGATDADAAKAAARISRKTGRDIPMPATPLPETAAPSAPSVAPAAPAATVAPVQTVPSPAGGPERPPIANLLQTDVNPATGRRVMPIAPGEVQIPRLPVQSRAFNSYGYDPANRILEVEFKNGKLYRYYDVTQQDLAGITGAESKGAAILNLVRKYPGTREGTAPPPAIESKFESVLRGLQQGEGIEAPRAPEAVAADVAASIPGKALAESVAASHKTAPSTNPRAVLTNAAGGKPATPENEIAGALETMLRQAQEGKNPLAPSDDLAAAAAEAAAAVPDEAPTTGGKAPRTVENASGESAASAEAQSRQKAMRGKGERFVVYDRAGNKRPLIGPDAVDYVAKRGETYGVEGPDGFRVLDNKGGKVPAAPAPAKAPPKAPATKATTAPAQAAPQTTPGAATGPQGRSLEEISAEAIRTATAPPGTTGRVSGQEVKVGDILPDGRVVLDFEQGIPVLSRRPTTPPPAPGKPYGEGAPSGVKKK